MAALTPEKRVQNKIIEYLKELEDNGSPVQHFRRDAIGPSYKKGLPDLYIVVGPLHIEVEVKAPGEKPRADQERWHRRFRSIGCPVWVIDNFENFKTNIKNILDTYS